MTPSSTLIDSPSLLAYGDTNLLAHEPALILNSRQSKTPVGNDPWVSTTVKACRSMIDAGHPLIASVGMNTWELILWATGEFSGHAIVLIPSQSNENIAPFIEKIEDDFNLKPENHLWIPVQSEMKNRSEKHWWRQRDETAFDLTKHIVPISIRPNGELENHIARYSQRVSIDDRFRYGYEKGNAEREIAIPSRCREFDVWPYITHWTCRCNGPWPDEKPSSFFSDIVASHDIYPRNALFTLRKILRDNRLIASGKHIRESTPVVAFTSLKPDESIQLMRWRKRYVRPTFEPYGIAIRNSTAMSMGIEPVQYVKSHELVDGSVPCMVQGYGTGNWPEEAEWRAIGDVNLSELSDDDAVVLVPTT
jgi:hypothetical protein